jgi:predicted GIY-YIG superfamily endonuclease
MPVPTERTALHRLYSTTEEQGLPTFLDDLYPKFLSVYHYLGAADSCPNGGPGITYGMWDFECDGGTSLVRAIEWGVPATPIPTALYRLFDAAGSLLYIGVSVSPEQRWLHHAEHKTWWPEVARIEFAWHGTRDEALTCEMESIRAEKPRYNVQHNGHRTVSAP